MICTSCGKELIIGDWPWCPHGSSSNFAVIGDDIPGGVWIRHGICNPDGTPKKYYSMTEIKKAAFEKNLTHGNDTPKPNQRVIEQEQKARESKGKA